MNDLSNLPCYVSFRQCCIASEEPVLSVLLKLTSNLEHCKKSLSVYLMEKRLSFPRLFYIPDDGLLALLSNPGSVRSVTPYLRQVVYSITTCTCTCG